MISSQNMSNIEAFAHEARTFCAWVAGADGSYMTATSALIHISSLYTKALSLPHPWSESLSDKDTTIELPKDSVIALQQRAGELPFQFYWEVFDPLENPPQEPSAGHILDDVHDIYHDVVRGLVLFDSGQIDEAVWQWGFNFQIHWGKHAVGAMRALHEFLAHHGPNSLWET